MSLTDDLEKLASLIQETAMTPGKKRDRNLGIAATAIVTGHCLKELGKDLEKSSRFDEEMNDFVIRLAAERIRINERIPQKDREDIEKLYEEVAFPIREWAIAKANFRLHEAEKELAKDTKEGVIAAFGHRLHYCKILRIVVNDHRRKPLDTRAQAILRGIIEWGKRNENIINKG